MAHPNPFQLIQQPRDLADRPAHPGEAGLGADRSPELHTRQVVYRSGFYLPLCSCGWMGGGYRTELEALRVYCEVDEILAVSAERKRRFLEGQSPLERTR